MGFLKRAPLPFAVFVTGACVLIIEIVATRILAPYFGNTVYSVSSVISVVLAALSLGYWLGGRIADRYPSKKVFFGIIFISGLLVLSMQIIQSNVLPAWGNRLPLDIGPLIMSLILFFMPSFVLGMLSPYAVALEQREAKHQGVGTTAGEIFFFSTVGSIAGSLLAGFALIPFFGLQTILTGVGITLILLGLIPLAVLGFGRRLIIALVFVGAALIIQASAGQSLGGNIIYSRDGTYEKIAVVDTTYKGREARFLMQDTSYSAAIYLGSDELAFDYTKYFSMYKIFTSDINRALSIGGGAYSIPKALLADSPKVTVDVSEIEPLLPELSKKYFGLKDDPRLNHYIKDGRRMLRDTPHRYDVIFSDVYHSMYSIPSHFTTKEFMELASKRLTQEGIFIANLIGSLDDRGPSFVWSEVKTMQQVFEQVYVFGVVSPSGNETQNIVVIGSKNPKRLDVNHPKWRENANQVIHSMADHYVATERVSLERYPILTDDFAPVDYLAAKILPER